MKYCIEKRLNERGVQMTRKEVVETLSVKNIVYQPGNGTRYEVVLGRTKDRLFIAVTNIRSFARFFADYGVLHYVYFKEKTGLDDSDAAALLVLMHEEAGRSVMLPPGFNKKGLYDNAYEHKGAALGVDDV